MRGSRNFASCEVVRLDFPCISLKSITFYLYFVRDCPRLLELYKMKFNSLIFYLVESK